MIFKSFWTVAALLVLACSSVTPEKFTSDKPLYEHASKLFAQKNYGEAIPFFESLRNRFPQSPYLLDTELKIGEARFEKGDYAEAEIDFQNFRLLHPTNPKIPFVTYMLGMTHFKRIPSGIDRDQTQTERALAVFEELSRRWPAVEQTAKAAPLLTRCKQDLLKRELYIADFYLKRKEYTAALGRLEGVRANPDFKELNAEATYKLGYAHYKMKNAEQAKEILGKLLQNPDGKKYHEKARELLRE